MAGGAPLALYIDWNVSGGTTRRPDYQRLRADIAAGKVGTVYAYSISRLARSARELLDLLDDCKAHDVAVQTDAEGPIVGRGAFGKFINLVMAGIAEMERDLASERTLAAHAVRRERGDHIGPVPYGTQLADRDTLAHGEARPLVANPAEPFDAVVAAYRETRSLRATARKLNTDGVPTKHGGKWRESSLRKMLRARAPGLLPTVKGARPAARAYLLTGILRCPHDDEPLSPKANHRRWVACHCPAASANASHPRPFSVAETRVLPWVRDEIAHADLGGDQAAAVAEDQAQRAALAARLERANELYMAGRITRERSDAEAAAVADEMDKLGDAVVVADLGDLDEMWTWAPVDANRVLRAILERVELGPDLRPVSAVWRNPALRRDCGDPACTHCLAFRS
jgi:DNA invertase Pin-like site-specific DNA recombinase